MCCNVYCTLILLLTYKFALAFHINFLHTKYTKTEEISQCVTKLSFEIMDANILVMSTIRNEISKCWQYSSPVVILSMQQSVKYIPRLEKIDAYILIFSSNNEFSDWLSNVYLLEFWNPSGKFIVSFSKPVNVTQVFEKAWKYYIININVVLPINNSFGVFTYYPYNSASCSINTTAVFLHLCSAIMSENLFLEKVPYNFNACPIKLQGCPVTPYVLNTSDDKADPTKAGYEVTIMNTLLTRINLTQIYVKHNYPTWGTKLSNGTYSFMFGELQNRTIDMVMGMASLDKDAKDFDALTFTILDFTIWWVPSANPFPLWTNLFNIFTFDTWIYILVSIFVNGIVVWLVGRTENDVRIFKNLLDCIIASWHIVLQGSVTPPKNQSLKILLIFWLIFSILLYTVHQSQLINTLMKPQYEKQIASVEEMIKSNLKFGFFYPNAEQFKDPQNPVDKHIRENFISCPIGNICINQTAFQRNFATMKTKRQMMFLMRKAYTYSDGRPMIYGFGPGFTLYSRYVVRKGFPPMVRLNKLIGLLSSNGLIRKWDNELIYKKKNSVKHELKSLTLAHLMLGFMYLVTGLSLATIVLISEIIVKYCNK